MEKEKGKSIREARKKSTSKRADPWQKYSKFKTPRGVTVKIADVEKYLTKLNEGHAVDEVAALKREGVQLSKVTIYRLFVRGAFDRRKLEAAIRALASQGKKFCVCQIRVSGSENQQDGASLPQQERDNVLLALRSGAENILVVVEVFSATQGHERALFRRLIRAIEACEIECWVASPIDRITRTPLDAVLFIVAVEKTGMILRSSSHSGPVKPNDALVLMIIFIVGAFHGNAISAGNLRGWKQRISRGEFPNSGQPLPGMQIGPDGKPSWSLLAVPAIRGLFELLDPVGSEPKTVTEALGVVNTEYPGWWRTSRDDIDVGPPSRARVIRLLSSSALVDGQQTFAFGSETFSGTYLGLAGVVGADVFERVRVAVAPDDGTLTREGLTAWARTFYELVAELGHPVSALIAESEGTLRWNPDGTFRVACPKCVDVTPEPEMEECDPHYDDLILADGTVRRNYRVPVFRCEQCNSTTRPLSLRALRLLLSRRRLACCPWCQGYDLGHVLLPPGLSAEARPRIEATCRRCKRDFDYDASYALASERYRYFVDALEKPVKPAIRPEADLAQFFRDATGGGGE